MLPIKYFIPVILITVGILVITIPVDSGCTGNAQCITGKVTKVIDGDTIKVDGQSIRFALTSTPEMYEEAGILAKQYIEKICPVGSTVLVDEDDLQTKKSYDRIIGKITCKGKILNETVLKSGHGEIDTIYCKTSEFADSNWAKYYGC
jgi:micrococcal nuclease